MICVLKTMLLSPAEHTDRQYIYTQELGNSKIAIFVFALLSALLLFIISVFQTLTVVKYRNDIYSAHNSVEIEFAIAAIACYAIAVAWSIIHFVIGWISAARYFRNNIINSCINVFDIAMSSGLVVCMICIALFVPSVPEYKDICKMAWTIVFCAILVEVSAVIKYSCTE